MKRINIVIIGLLFLNLFMARGQEMISSTAKETIPVVKFSNDISVKFGGFVRAEYYIDNREIVGVVDDLLGFFPKNKNPDTDGDDLNKVVRQGLSVQATRFNMLVSGPAFLKARSNAYIEYDFTGGNTVHLRLRHAWAKLSWDKAELLIGKTWNPLAETPFPLVAGLHTGIPFRPFGRGDQIRFTYKPTDRIHILAAGLYQSEHKNILEESSNGNVRSNPIPDLHLQLHYKTKSFSTGLLAEYKVVRPATQITTTNGIYKTSETVSSFALVTYADYKANRINVNGGAICGQNLSELFQQGGYAVKSVNAETGKRTYTPSSSISCWANATYGRQWIAGLFVGYQKNLGFMDNPLADGDFFGRWQDVDHIYRISPSLKYEYKQWAFQAELDYNVAAYGTVDFANKGKVKNSKEVAGARGLFATTFFF